MRGRGNRFFAMGMLVLAFLAGTIWASWSTIGIWIAPKTVLSCALQDAVDGLHTRLDRHPVALIAPLINHQGLFLAEGEIAFTGFTFTGTLTLDLPQYRLMADGSISAGTESNEVSLFLDPEKASVRFAKLSPNYYGISFDSFRKELDEIPLLTYFLDRQLFNQWETRIDTLENTMESMVSVPSFPSIPEGWIEAATKAVLFLPSRTEKAECPVDGCIFCRKIVYSLQGDSLDVLRKAGVPLESGLNSFRVDFVVHKNVLVQMDAEAHSGDQVQKLSLKLTGEAPFGKIELSCFDGGQESDSGFSVAVSSCPVKDHITESWDIWFYEYGKQRNLSFSYQWYPESGDLYLKNGSGSEMQCILKPKGNGIYFKCEDVRKLKSVVTSSEVILDSLPIACDLTVKKGSAFLEPEYTPLRDWSLEEFASILTILIPLFG